MNCHSVAAVLDLYAEGRLTPRRKAMVEAHLSSCVSCEEMAEPLDAIRPSAAASAPGAKRPGDPSDFKARLSAALKSERASTPAPRVEIPLLWPRELSGVAWAAAAVAAVALAIGWSGAPSQQYEGGDELAAGRLP